MKPPEQIEIEVNKINLLWLLLGLSVFIALGIIFVVNHTELANPWSRHGNPLWILIVGIISIVFWTPAAFFVLRRILSNKPGLIINKSEVLVDYLNDKTISVAWSDIKDIRIVGVKKDKYIAFVVNNPQSYINKSTSSGAKRVMSTRYSEYGSPIAFPVSTLKKNVDDLHRLLIEKMKEYKQQ